MGIERKRGEGGERGERREGEKKPTPSLSLMKTVINIGDALNTNLPPQSIDLVVTSPPYFAFREYTDGEKKIPAVGNEPHPYEYLNSLEKWMLEMRRVVRPAGNIFVVVGDKYAGSGGHNNATIGAPAARGPKRYVQSAVVTPPPDEVTVPNKSRLGLPWRWANQMVDLGFVLRSEIIWSKPNSIPTNARDRTEFSHEYIFHFALTQKHYHHPSLPRYPSVWPITASEGLRFPSDVLDRIGSDRHFAAFPAEIPRRIIGGWCPENGVVLDPFAGSGTTALVSKLLGRSSFSLDLSAAYVKLARWRVFASDHRAKLEERWQNQGLI